MTKYAGLQALTKSYGEKTIELCKGVRIVRDKVLSELPKYLGCDKSKVSGVPPFSDFEPATQYRDACLSSHGQGVTYLEPIHMGICTIIDNQDDAGWTWVRTVIEIWLQGDEFIVSVGDAKRKAHVSTDCTRGMDDLLELIHRDIEEAFSLELHEATGANRIGFKKPTS
ncbi:MAG: hypothetical protein AAFX90_20480 [Pseudomonadota bacterium]